MKNSKLLFFVLLVSSISSYYFFPFIKNYFKPHQKIKLFVPNQPFEWEEPYSKGQKFLVEKKYNEAIEQFEKVYLIKPVHMGNILNLSWCYAQLGDYDKGIFLLKEFKRAVNNAPRRKIDLQLELILAQKDVSIYKETRKKNGPKFFDEMALIPEGEFIMGTTGVMQQEGIDYGIDEMPQHRVYLPSYYMDKYEVTNYRYKRYIAKSGADAPNKDWQNKSYPKGKDDEPVAEVSWFEAQDFCKSEGKQLPSEQEWEKAARGTSGQEFPWGNDGYKPFFGNNRKFFFEFYTPVGSFPQGVSPYGIFDMMGNVEEWTDSWYDAYPGSTLKRKNFGKIYRILRGGSILSDLRPYSRAAYRNFAKPGKKYRTIGFRCAKEAR